MADETDTASPDGSASYSRSSKSGTVTVKQYRDDPPFDPNSAGSDELFEALSEIGKYTSSCTEQIYELAYDNFRNNIDPDDLQIINGTYLKQTINFAESNHIEWVDSLQNFTDQFFDGIESSNFVSGDTRSAIDEPISPNKAKEYLEKREQQFTNAATAAFGSSEDYINEVLIQKAQKAYLWNIWESIDNSEIKDQAEYIQKKAHIQQRSGQLERCQNCGREQGLVGKYEIWLCRQCFRELSRNMGFKKYS